MNVLFLSNFYPRCKRDYYLSRSRAGLASAADAHQYALAQGLNEVVKDFKIINLPSVPPFPHRNKDFFTSGQSIQENGLTIDNIGSCNLAFYQFLSRYRHAKAALKGVVLDSLDLTYIVVYATNFAFLRAATEMRKEYNNIRICLIVPDLPEDMASGRFASLRKRFSLIFFKSYQEYIGQFDSFVLLTRTMADKLGCKEGSFIVNEGVYNDNDSFRDYQCERNEKFTVFYSGMLYRKFGVMNLVDAILHMQSKDIQLLLCGYGELVDEVKKISRFDERIKYLGILSRQEALQYQAQADLLVNPRVPDQNPYTKYSFPSKNLEYLASGTPTLLYQLEGIPVEYYNYCYYLDKDHTDVDSLSSKIKEIIRIPMEERNLLAQAARNFVLSNKNPRKAGEAIIHLLNSTV